MRWKTNIILKNEFNLDEATHFVVLKLSEWKVMIHHISLYDITNSMDKCES